MGWSGHTPAPPVTNLAKGSGERLQWLDESQRLPRRQGSECNVLRLMTGADNIRPLAKFATKPTALLVDGLQSVGDFGQHREDFDESTVTKGFVACVVLCAIELVEKSCPRLIAGKGLSRCLRGAGKPYRGVSAP